MFAFRQFLIIVLLSHFFAISFAQQPNIIWQKNIDGQKLIAENSVLGMTSDLNGDFILVGRKDSAAKSITFLKKNHSDGSDVFYFPIENNICNAVTTDLTGNIYIGGWAWSGPYHYFNIWKFDSTGTLQWNMIDSASNASNIEIFLSCDSIGNTYFATNLSSGGALRQGKVNSNGQLVRSTSISGFNRILFFKLQSDNRLAIMYSYPNPNEFAIYDSTNILVNNFNVQNIEYNTASAKMDEYGNIFVVGMDVTYDSLRVARLDYHLNLLWSRAFYLHATEPILDVRMNLVNVLTDTDPRQLISLDYSGNFKWQQSLNVSGVDGSVNCDGYGNVYVATDSITLNGRSVTLQRLDSTGMQTFSKTFDSYYSIVSPNSKLSTDFLFCCHNIDPNNKGYLLFGIDTTLTDTFSVFNKNIQSFDDKGLILKKDNNGDLICVCIETDTIYSNAFGNGTCLEILKFDINGNLIWDTRVHVNYRPFAYEVHVDRLNNIYVCGQANIAGTNGAKAFAIELNSYGQQLWEYDINPPNPQQSNIGWTITTDSSLNVYFGGMANNTINLIQSAFLVKLNQNGDTLWTKFYSDIGTSKSISSVIGQRNIVYALMNTYQSSGSEFQIMQFDTSGNVIRQISSNPSLSVWANKMIIDGNNNFYCFGSSYSGHSGYIVKYDFNGTIVGEWQDSTITPAIIDAVVSENGIIYISSFTQVPNTLTAAFDSTCNLLWSKIGSGEYGDQIDYANGNVYVTTRGMPGDTSYFIGYDSLGTLLFDEYIPSSLSYTYDILADSNALYLLGTAHFDTSGYDIVLNKYQLINLSAFENLHSDSKIFPNPSKGKFELLIPDKQCDAICIYNSLGAIVKCLDVTKNTKIEINLELYNSGIYYYVVHSENNIVSRGKLIKL